MNEKLDTNFEIYVTQEERDFLENKTGSNKNTRCECGHLWALHSTHCCNFCMVPNCNCERS